MNSSAFEKAILDRGTAREDVANNRVTVTYADGERIAYEKTLDPAEVERKAQVTKRFNKAPGFLIRWKLQKSAKEGAPIARGFIESPGGYRLFRELYKFKTDGPFEVDGKPHPIDYALGTSEAGFGVRNRFERMRRVFRLGLDHLADDGPNVFFGYGSGDAWIEQNAMRNAIDNGRDWYFVGFDNSATSRADAQSVAEELGLEDRVFMVHLDHDMSDSEAPVRETIANVLEPSMLGRIRMGILMGINEYMDLNSEHLPFSNTEIVNLHKTVKNALSPGGYAVSTQTKPHDRQPLLEKLPTPWICRYRNEHEHMGVVLDSGLTLVMTESDPTGLSSYIVAKKGW